MEVVIDLCGEAAEEYMKDKLSKTMRRLIVGNEWACERETATELKRALERSHIAAETERKNGKWILVHPLQSNDEGYTCSVCGTGDYSVKPTDKYCKFCGSKMTQMEGDGEND